MKKVLVAAEAREAAAKAKKALKDRKSILSGGGLPGKLFDCTTRDRDASELFLVEGEWRPGLQQRFIENLFPKAKRWTGDGVTSVVHVSLLSLDSR